MSEVMKDGGPAFPTHWPTATSKGATLRDYFAAKALPLVFKLHIEDADHENNRFIPDPEFYLDDDVINIAIDAYAMADAMLRARDK